VPKVWLLEMRLLAHEALVEVAERAGARTPRIATGAASAGGSRRAPAAFRGHALGRHGKNAKLRAELLALTLGALGLVAPEDKGFKFVLAFLADVFENRHDDRSLGAD
jgi:hypothetical protein